MLSRLLKARQKSTGNPPILYGAIVAQARSPAFYSIMGVADTVDGRFEMVVLHTHLAVRRLLGGSVLVAPVGQAVFDLFCEDMDRSLRELGVGDMAVPKRMRKLGEAYYGRAAAYDEALAASDGAALADALARNVFPDGDARRGAPALAAYVRAAVEALAAVPEADLADGRAPFPEPSDFVPAGSTA
jgi:cytochrome b pre-mRNA-processing protein 3